MERYAVRSSSQADRRRLEAAGFDSAQAEALLQMIGDSQEALATKQDIAEVRADLRNLATTVAKNAARIDALERAMEALRQEVRDRFESFRQEIAGQMDGLRGQMDGLRGEMDGLRGEMKSEVRALKWLVGGMFAVMAPMIAAILGLSLR